MRSEKDQLRQLQHSNMMASPGVVSWGRRYVHPHPTPQRFLAVVIPTPLSRSTRGGAVRTYHRIVPIVDYTAQLVGRLVSSRSQG